MSDREMLWRALAAMEVVMVEIPADKETHALYVLERIHDEISKQVCEPDLWPSAPSKERT